MLYICSMKPSDLTYRMYGLVPYNISPIQQGIQFGHGVVEYMLKYSDKEECKVWSSRDKTFIVLNGGTTNNCIDRLGTLNIHLKNLTDMGIDVSTFYEPDLGDQLTSINFIVDERVFDKVKYPEPIITSEDSDADIIRKKEEFISLLGGEKNFFLRNYLKNIKKA